MNSFQKNFGLIIGSLIFLAATALALFFASGNLKQFKNSYSGRYHINWGLDLQGGAQILMAMKTDTVIQTSPIGELRSEISEQLRTLLLPYRNMESSELSISFLVNNTQSNKDKLTQLATDLANKAKVTQREITDEKGNPSVKFTAEIDRRTSLTEQTGLTNQIIGIIKRRLDETGTREINVQQQGRNGILIQAPGVFDIENLKSILGRTAQLTFHLVNQVGTQEMLAAVAQSYEEILPGMNDAFTNEPMIYYLVNKKADLTGDMLLDARAAFSYAEPVVEFRLTRDGQTIFGNITSQNQGKMLAVVLDNRVISSPMIREAILGGRGVINGNFTAAEATELSLLLRSGALPVPLETLESKLIGPSLGEDSIKGGMRAVATSLTLVILSMIVLYRLFGLFAAISLILNGLYIIAILSIFNITLTLAGVAGIILTFGMAVDINVIIFERMREESNQIGSSRSTFYDILESSFAGAIRSVIDSNITTLIIASMLFVFGISNIKSFALTLMIGILCSVPTAIFVSKILISWWAVLTNWNTSPKYIRISNK